MAAAGSVLEHFAFAASCEIRLPGHLRKEHSLAAARKVAF
jgi:hypothetical protein